MIVYEVPLGWNPDIEHVNHVGADYYAWRLSVNKNAGLELWVVEVMVAQPVLAIEDILPEDYKQYDLKTDTQELGYERQWLPRKSILEVQENLTEDIDKFSE